MGRENQQPELVSGFDARPQEYQYPVGIQSEDLRQSMGHRVIYSPRGGGVAVDEQLWRIWQAAAGHTLADILKETQPLHLSSSVISTCVGLLCEAGLLERGGAISSENSYPRERDLRDLKVAGDFPVVSVIIPTHDGKEHLEDCLPSLECQTYPAIQPIVVDNASGPAVQAFLQEHFPSVKVVRLEEYGGYVEAYNLGMRAAQGELLIVINDDTEMDARFVEELVRAQRGEERVAAVVPKMRLFYSRAFLNGLGNTVGFEGWGYDNAIGYLDLGQFDHIRAVPSACFGAVMFRREALEAVGWPDERYIIYYDDVDWSQRAGAMGYRIVTAPAAVIYHKFGATMGASVATGPSRRKLQLVVQNRLRYVLRNLEPRNMRRFLYNYFQEDLRNMLYELRQHNRPGVRAYLGGWASFLMQLPALWRERRRFLAKRSVSDSEIFQLALQFPSPLIRGDFPLLTVEAVKQHYLPALLSGQAHSIPELTGQKGISRLLIISPDVVASNMAGPGIRYWELSRVLAKSSLVTLAVPAATDLVGDGFRVVVYDEQDIDSLRPLVAESEIVLFSNYLVNKFPYLRNLDQYVIVDLYDPFTLENLEIHRDKPLIDQMVIHQHGLGVINELLGGGDFFICATEKQRDFWMGMLLANNRINPLTYDSDKTGRDLIDISPYGLSPEQPIHSHPVLKGVVSGISSEDKIILWGGGIWDWFDPVTLIRAMPIIVAQEPRARLFFIGVRHPNPQVPDSRVAEQVLDLSRELGLLDKYVFYNDWTPYLERENYLVEADVGVSFHVEHVETRFSSRTRLLDYIWAGLPMVLTRGDSLGEMIAAHGLAKLVSPGDVQATAEAILFWLAMPDAPVATREKFTVLQEQLSWEQVAEPIRRFCQSPYHAADRRSAGETVSPGPAVARSATSLWRLPMKGLRIVRRDGWSALRREALTYVQWRLSGGK